MAVTFRIDQPSSGLPAGVSDRSRHDLLPGYTIRLTVTEPAAASGITYKWRVVDQAGMPGTAAFSPNDASAIVNVSVLPDRFGWAYLFELQVFQDGELLGSSKRIGSCLTFLRKLRVPVFGETADPLATIEGQRIVGSTDNALYQDLADRGVEAQNWRGWSELLHRLTMAVEDLAFYDDTPATLGSGADPGPGDSPLPARGNHSHPLTYGDDEHMRRSSAYRPYGGMIDGPAHIDHVHGGQEWRIIGIGDAANDPAHDNVIYTFGDVQYHDPEHQWRLSPDQPWNDYYSCYNDDNLFAVGVTKPVWNNKCYFVARATTSITFNIPKQPTDTFSLIDAPITTGREIAGVQVGTGPITFAGGAGVSIHSVTGFVTAGAGSRFHLIRSRRFPADNIDHWDLTIFGATEGGEGGGGGDLPAAGGDLSGDWPGISVVGLRGNPMADWQPSTGDVLVWENDSYWIPRAQRAFMTGDVVGNTGDNEVRGLRDRPIGAAVPTTGDMLTFVGASWIPRPTYILGYPITGTPAAGDVLIWDSGTSSWITGSVESTGSNATTLQSRPVAAGAPEEWQVLGWDGSEWTPTTLTVLRRPVLGEGATEGQVLTYVDADGGYWTPADPAGGGGGLPELEGDATGPINESTVVALQGYPVTPGIEPYESAYLRWTGMAWEPGDIWFGGHQVLVESPTAGQVLTLVDEGGESPPYWAARDPAGGGEGGEGGGTGDAVSLQSFPIVPNTPIEGQVLGYISAGFGSFAWGPVDPPAGGSNAESIQAVDVSETLPTDGQVLTYDEGSTEWVPRDVPASGAAGWQSAIDINFAAEANLTLADGANTIGGKTWTGEYIAARASSAAIVNGTGLRIANNTVLSEVFTIVPYGAPNFYIPILDLIPGFALGQTEIRILAQLETNASHNHEAIRVAILKRPWVENVMAHWEIRHGYYDGSGPRAGALVLQGGNGGAAPNRADYAAGTAVAGANNVMGFHWNLHKALFYRYTTALGLSAVNNDIFNWSEMTLGATWLPSSGAAVGQATMAAQPVPVKASDLYLAIICSEQNTLGTHVGVLNRLRVEYKL